MSYTLTVTNGSSIVVQNGTIDTSTSLQLVGKNYPSYGLAMNQNLVNLLQSSAGTGQPAGALTGQLWWDTTHTILKVYTGTVFKNITSVTSSASQPTSAIVQGDLWFDSSNLQLYVYTGTAWLLVGPSYSSSQQKTTAIALNILDNVSATHTVLAFYVGNVLTGMLSKDAAFTPATPISGFAIVNPGYNINSTIFSASGILINGTLTTNAQPYVTTLGTLTALNVSGLLTSSGGLTVTGGATMGGGMSVTGGLSMSSAITTTGTGTYNIGTNANKFGTVYATAQTALYADLAENYVSDDTADPIAIMIIGGDEEVTPSTVSHDPRVIGVMSQNPAYLMNTAIDGIGSAIALTGRVPVRVKGPIGRGDCVVSSDTMGVGEKLDMYRYTPGCIVGKALVAINDDSIRTIEVVIGVR